MCRLQSLLSLLLLLTFTTLSLAASSTSFCKCTCFTNSTIIQLDGSPSTTHKGVRGTCADCNRKFCLGYNLPICKGANEEDVVTTCFQRDSIKDQIAVYLFIFATMGLLLYAGARPWVDEWVENWKERKSYMPVSSGGGVDES